MTAILRIWITMYAQFLLHIHNHIIFHFDKFLQLPKPKRQTLHQKDNRDVYKLGRGRNFFFTPIFLPASPQPKVLTAIAKTDIFKTRTFT